ncbi:TetR/AcrR family transcriptional regulator [Paraferrimonas haliotis]|nr:TetR/AcrR family transcriptional regulator [Paraferrimonas haliotis]
MVRNSRSAIKHRRILDAATQLFCEQGFMSTSMDEIARLAEVSKQTVYAHFGNKNQLFVAAIEARVADTMYQGDLLTDAQAPQQTLEHFGQQFLSLLGSKEAIAVHRTCVAQAETHPELAQMFYQAGPVRIVESVSEYLQGLNQHGEYCFSPVRDAAIRLLTALKGEVQMRLELNLDVSECTKSQPEYIAATVKAFLLGHKSPSS